MILTNDNRSKEHVIPEWLQKYLGIGGAQLQQAIATTAEGTILKSRTHAASSFQEGRVCGSCNNGWMNDLETESMKLLKELVDARVSLMSLSDGQRASLAKWAAKTAFVLSHTALLQRTPDVSQMRYMQENRGGIPPGVWVVAQMGPRSTDFRQIQRNQWIHHTGVEPLHNPPTASYKIGLQFRHLLLLVAYWPEEKSEMILSTGIHIPLWPQNEFYLSRFETEFQSLDPADPATLLDRFCRSLSVTTVMPQ